MLGHQVCHKKSPLVSHRRYTTDSVSHSRLAFSIQNQTLQWNANTQLWSALLHQSLSKLSAEGCSCLSACEKAGLLPQPEKRIHDTSNSLSRQLYFSVLKYKHSIKEHSFSAHTWPMLLEASFLQLLHLSMYFSSLSLFNASPFLAERVNSRALGDPRSVAFLKRHGALPGNSSNVIQTLHVSRFSFFPGYKWPEF